MRTLLLPVPPRYPCISPLIPYPECFAGCCWAVCVGWRAGLERGRAGTCQVVGAGRTRPGDLGPERNQCFSTLFAQRICVEWRLFKQTLHEYYTSPVEAPNTSSARFRGKKIALKFPSGWKIGTFKSNYKGKKAELQGKSSIYFHDIRKSYYAILNPDEHGPDKMWCYLMHASMIII